MEEEEEEEEEEGRERGHAKGPPDRGERAGPIGGRAEAAWFGVAAPERGTREDAGPPLRVCSLAPRLPHSARSHPFPA